MTTDKDAIPQEDVIQKATGINPIPGRRIRNPLREDRTPKAFFAWRKGKLRLQDYADPKTHGLDCWDIYMKVFRLPDLNAAVCHYTGNVPVKKVPFPRYFPPTTEFRVEFDVIQFDEQGLAYWADYGITEEQLITDGVRQLGSYSFKSRSSDSLTITVIPEDICFALPTINGRNKVYRPLAADPKDKWKADTIPGQMWLLRRSEQPSEQAFITSSYKDGRVVFNYLEFDVFAPAVTESAPAEDIAGWGLMRQLKGYKFVTIGMDFDAAGHKAEAQWSAALKFHDIPHKIMGVQELNVDGHRIKDYAAMRKRFPERMKEVLG